MAGLRLGMPVATNAGESPEHVFQEDPPAAIASGISMEALALEAERLLGSPSLRAELGIRAAAVYEARFSLRHTVDLVRRLAADDEEAARPR